MKKRTSAVLLQSVLDEKWWADSMECYTYLRNIQDLEYYLVSAKDQSRLHQFGMKVLLGIVFGYLLIAGIICKGDILVADVEELENLDPSEVHARRLNAEEVLTSNKSDIFVCTIADGTAKLFGRFYGVRESTLQGESTCNE